MEIRKQMSMLAHGTISPDGGLVLLAWDNLKTLGEAHPDVLIEFVREGKPYEKSAALFALAQLVENKSLKLPENRRLFFETLQKETTPEHRLYCIAILRAMLDSDPDPEMEAALLPYFLDEMPEIRATMAIHAGQRQIVAAVPYLVKLLEEEDPRMRECARENLGKINSPEAQAALEIWEKRNKHEG